MFYFEIRMESYCFESVCEGRMTSILMSNVGLLMFSGGREHNSQELIEEHYEIMIHSFPLYRLGTTLPLEH